MIKLQKWILEHLCKTYYHKMFKLLCEKETQIENLKKINQYLRDENIRLNLLLKGITQ